MQKRRKILIAGPVELYPGCQINPTLDARDFFAQDDVEVWCSMDPNEAERADGIVVPGGLPDVSPACWGEENKACYVVDKQMDRDQLALIERAVQLRKPLLGICRGHQLISVFFGATLIQDIRCNDAHRYAPGAPRFHKIHNVPGTPLFELYGSVLHSNSAHHQAIKKLPECLRVAQLWCSDEAEAERHLRLACKGQIREGSDECIIEAVVHQDYPFLGLQWHPESGGELRCKDADTKRIRFCFYDIIQKEMGAG